MGREINVGGPKGPRKPDNAVQLARALGATPPETQLADTPALIAQEQETLLRCEAAIENLRVAFWAAGKALQVIRDTRLYRESHGTFEEYVLDRWDFTPQYAGRLIRTWRVAEKLFEIKSNGLETIVSKKLNQAQAWELVGLAEERGVDAAALLYLSLIKVRGTQVTAALVAGAAAALPAAAAGHKRKTEEAVLAYLASLEEAPALPADDPAKVVKALTRAVKTFDAGSLEAAMKHDPEKTRRAVKDLIELLSSAVGITAEVEADEPKAEVTAA